jgi:hypothetical protein
MAAQFADLWYPELTRSGITPDWPAPYMANREVSFDDETHPEPGVLGNDVFIDLEDDLFE